MPAGGTPLTVPLARAGWLRWRDDVPALPARPNSKNPLAARVVIDDPDFETTPGLDITEAGTKWSGSLKSAVGLGTLLADGIGDTIRISLSTFHAEEEVKVAWEVLKALKLRERGPVLIACPTCGRLQFGGRAGGIFFRRHQMNTQFGSAYS